MTALTMQVIPPLPIAEPAAHISGTCTGTEQGASRCVLTSRQATIVPRLPVSQEIARPPKIIPKLPIQEESLEPLKVPRTAQTSALRAVHSLTVAEDIPCNTARVTPGLFVASNACPEQPRTNGQKPSLMTTENPSKHACTMPALPVCSDQPLLAQNALLSRGVAAEKGSNSGQQVRQDSGTRLEEPWADSMACGVSLFESHSSSTSTAAALLDELLGPTACSETGTICTAHAAEECDKTAGNSAKTSLLAGSVTPRNEPSNPAPAPLTEPRWIPRLQQNGKSTFREIAAHAREIANRRLSLYPTGQECNSSVRKKARHSADQRPFMRQATTPEGLQVMAEATVHSTAQMRMPAEAKKSALASWTHAEAHNLDGTNPVACKGTAAPVASLISELPRPQGTARASAGPRRETTTVESPSQHRLDGNKMTMKLPEHKRRVSRSPMCWRSGAKSDDDSWPELQPEVAGGQEAWWKDEGHSCQSSEQTHTPAGNVDAAAGLHKRGRRGRRDRWFHDGFDCGVCRIQIPAHMSLEEHCRSRQHTKTTAKARGLHCVVCNVFCSCEKSLKAHLKGIRHAKIAGCATAEKEKPQPGATKAEKEHPEAELSEVEKKEQLCREKALMAEAVTRKQGRQQGEYLQPKGSVVRGAGQDHTPSYVFFRQIVKNTKMRSIPAAPLHQESLEHAVHDTFRSLCTLIQVLLMTMKLSHVL